MQNGYPRQSMHQQPAPVYIPVYPRYPEGGSGGQPGYQQAPTQDYRQYYPDQGQYPGRYQAPPPPPPSSSSNPWSGGQARPYGGQAGQPYWSSGPDSGYGGGQGFGQQGYDRQGYGYNPPRYAQPEYQRPRYRPLNEGEQKQQYREPQHNYAAPYDRPEGSSQSPGYYPGAPGYGAPYGGYGYQPGYSTGPWYGAPAPGGVWPGY